MMRGIESKHEVAARQLARDTRPLGTRIAEGLSRPEVMLLTCGTSIATSFAFPMATDVLLVLCICLFLFAITRKNSLPFRVPQSAHLKDYNDLIPGTTKPKWGEGIAFFGNDRLTQEEMWFSNDDLRTHCLIFGSTGSGKTEALVSIAFNALLYGSGFIYIDGKGDNSLYAKVFSMVRSMGREDDILLVNFMTGARDIIGAQKSRLSNTMNPFARGSSSMLSQLVVSIMSSGKQGGGNDDMWTGRAINFVESLMKVLTAMRDAGFILLDANSIRDYFILEKLEQIVVDKRFPITDTYSIPLDAYPPQVLEPLTAYILNLPGYNRQKKGNQGSEVREQHGFITMQLTRAFGSLADTYGHIIRTNLAEVDFKDVVLNRRILVVLLPALEKSPQELSNLGKIIIASLKAMMAAGLGEEIEGDYRDVVLRKPTNSPTPFICIMDEYGYYAVEGFAVVPAQARSLGFSAIFAGQDLPAFQKASKEEAASIGANCNIKICMKLEDPQETWEFFNKVAGEAYVTSVSGFQMDATSMTMNYMDTRNASVDKRQRIDVLDLKDQRPGEAHVFFKSKIVRAEMFYAAPKPVKRLCVNQFLKVEPPNDEQLTAMGKRLKRFKEILTQPHYEMPEPMMSTDINTMAQTLQGAINLKPFERGIAALISLLEQEVQKQRDLSVPFEEPGVEGEMSAFTKIFITPLVHRMIGDENVELFTLPLIRRGSTTEEMKHIQRLLGESEQDALKHAESVIRDIETATQFPPAVDYTVDADTLVQDISDLIQQMGGEALDLHGLHHQVAADAATAEQEQHEEFEFADFPDFPDLSEMDFEEDEEETEDDEDESGGSEAGEEAATSTLWTEDQHEETEYADHMETEAEEEVEAEEETPEPTWDDVRAEIARKEQEAKASGNEFPDLDLSDFEYEMPEEQDEDHLEHPVEHPVEHPEHTDVAQEQKEKTEAEKEKDKTEHEHDSEHSEDEKGKSE